MTTGTVAGRPAPKPDLANLPPYASNVSAC